MYGYCREKFYVNHFWESKGLKLFLLLYRNMFLVIKEMNWRSGVWFLMAMHTDFILCPTLTLGDMKTKWLRDVHWRQSQYRLYLPTFNKRKDIFHFSLQSSNINFILKLFPWMYVIKSLTTITTKNEFFGSFLNVFWDNSFVSIGLR